MALGPPKTVGKQVDYMRTSNSMLVRGEAYLKERKRFIQVETEVRDGAVVS